MQLSLTAVSYVIWALCEVGNKQSALIRRVNKVESVRLLLCSVESYLDHIIVYAHNKIGSGPWLYFKGSSLFHIV